MKKIIYALAITILFSTIFSCFSCTKNKNFAVSNSAKNNSDEQTDVDFDFTKMNYNMISSITFEILVNPKKYVNKIVKISGDFYETEHEDKKYYSVLIWDATGCCPAGLNFIPSDSVKEQFGSIEQNSKITVTGILKYDTSEENSENLIFTAEKIE